jgi:hypothetical protein
MRALPVMVFCLGIIADIGNEDARCNGIAVTEFRKDLPGQYDRFLTLKSFSFFEYRHDKLFE